MNRPFNLAAVIGMVLLVGCAPRTESCFVYGRIRSKPAATSKPVDQNDTSRFGTHETPETASSSPQATMRDSASTSKSADAPATDGPSTDVRSTNVPAAGVPALPAESSKRGASAAPISESPKPEAMSLLGRPLFALGDAGKVSNGGEGSGGERAQRILELESKLAAAREDWSAFLARPQSSDASPADGDHVGEDSLIWVGRRLGYLYRMNEAIAAFSEGVQRWPNDARFLRHRGHRLISLRRFEEAATDLEAAARMMRGRPDDIEPDGMPNTANVPLTSTAFNVWYHLGVARFMLGDYGAARAAFEETLKSSRGFDDNVAAAAHWMYMCLRRMRRHEEAALLIEQLSPPPEEMKILENEAYRRLLMFYSGRISEEGLLGIVMTGAVDERVKEAERTIGTDTSAATGAVDRATLLFGAANWHRANADVVDKREAAGERARAKALCEEIVKGEAWPAFAFIAAEVDLKSGK